MKETSFPLKKLWAYSLIFFSLLVFNFNINAQVLTNMALTDVMYLARSKSIASITAQTKKENSYWDWKAYLSNYKPQLTLGGTLFDFNRSFQPTVQPDGNTLFQPIANNNSNLSLSISQPIAFTGTSLFLRSNLNRFDDFDANLNRYNGSPIILGIQHNFFGFNNLKWDKEIEPLKFEESLRGFKADLADIDRQTCLYFFSAFQAQERYKIATFNKLNADTLLSIGVKRYEKAAIFKSDLLQLQLAVKSAEKNQIQARVDKENALRQLKSYVGLTQSGDITLSLNSAIPLIVFDEHQALEQALTNKAEIIAYTRRKKEAEMSVAKAKSLNGFSFDMFATAGLTNRADELPAIYQDPTNLQTFRLGFNIPILDWGRSQARLQSAIANQELIRYTAVQDETNFKEQVLSQARQLQSLRQQLEITLSSSAIALERYALSKLRYINNGITINALNIAIQEKDNAINDHINTLSQFWNTYYELRFLTLYDFQSQQPLSK